MSSTTLADVTGDARRLADDPRTAPALRLLLLDLEAEIDGLEIETHVLRVVAEDLEQRLDDAADLHDPAGAVVDVLRGLVCGVCAELVPCRTYLATCGVAS